MQATLDFDTQVRVDRCASAQSSKDVLAQDIALALLGVGALSPLYLSQGITWQKGGASLVGHPAVLAACGCDRLSSISVEDVVTHGKAAAVSGHLKYISGEKALFCHMIRFSSASARQVASIVSFEHSIREKLT